MVSSDAADVHVKRGKRSGQNRVNVLGEGRLVIRSELIGGVLPRGLLCLQILERLVAHAGWAELGRVIPVRCFTHDPSIKSSLTFLRKTPWARAKVEAFYLDCLDEIGPTSDKSNEGSAI